MTARAKPKTAKAKPPVPRVAAIHDIDADAAERARGGVQSLGRAFAIMEEIARNRDGIGLAELSKRVGLHNSTTFHLVKTLVTLGYVRQLKDSKRYRIGRPLFALAASALDELEMSSLATPVLEELARVTGEAAHFSVRMGDAVVVLARTTGPGAFQLTDRVGVMRPAHCTALGKVMLAALHPDQFERFLERAELKGQTPKSITRADALRREITEVRRAGMAFDDGATSRRTRSAAGCRSSTACGPTAVSRPRASPAWRRRAALRRCWCFRRRRSRWASRRRWRSRISSASPTPPTCR